MRRLAGALLGVAAVLVGASPAVAADGTTISYVERNEQGLQILVSVPPDAEVELGNVAVTIDGTTAAATAAQVDDTAEVRRTAVLVMDTSQSMSGQRIAAAQAAARTFLDVVPDDVYVGIVTFDSDVTPALQPTLERDEARAVIDGIELSKQTRLYDGVQAGLSMAGTDGSRQLIVLSDGADTSDTELDGVTSAIGDAGVTVDVVSLEQDAPAAVAALSDLAKAGDGQVIEADSQALTSAFSAQADKLARQVLVTAEVPASITRSEATVAVTLGSSEGDLKAEAFAKIADPAAEGPAAAVVDTPMTLSSSWLYGGLAALGLGLLIVMIMATPRKAKPLTGAELATTYTQRVGVGRSGDDDPAAEAALAQATATAEKVLGASKSLESRIADRLEAAGNPFKPAEWLLLHVGVFVVMGLIGLLLGGGSLILGIIFLALGAIGPWFYLGFKRSRRKKAFESGLADTLQLIAGSLSAGLSLAQSIDTVVREGQEPISGEFKRVLVETRLGIELDDALQGVADRFESQDFAWIVMAIRIQRQVGGNLAELLDTVANTIREREYMRRQVAALAAEGKLSAWVLGGLPPAFMLYLLVAKRDYVMPMFTEPIGWMMLGGAVMLLSVGVFWMSRLVKVEV